MDIEDEFGSTPEMNQEPDSVPAHVHITRTKSITTILKSKARCFRVKHLLDTGTISEKIEFVT